MDLKASGSDLTRHRGCLADLVGQEIDYFNALEVFRGRTDPLAPDLLFSLVTRRIANFNEPPDIACVGLADRRDRVRVAFATPTIKTGETVFGQDDVKSPSLAFVRRAHPAFENPDLRRVGADAVVDLGEGVSEVCLASRKWRDLAMNCADPRSILSTSKLVFSSSRFFFCSRGDVPRDDLVDLTKVFVRRASSSGFFRLACSPSEYERAQSSSESLGGAASSSSVSEDFFRQCRTAMVAVDRNCVGDFVVVKMDRNRIFEIIDNSRAPAQFLMMMEGANIRTQTLLRGNLAPVSPERSLSRDAHLERGAVIAIGSVQTRRGIGRER